MRDRDLGAYRDDVAGRRMTRRTVLRFGLLAAALPLAAACGQQASPAPTAAPAKPAEAKPTEAAKPAAPAAQPAATKPAEAAKPAETKPAAQAPAVPKAKINGKLTVVQSRDFHPDHNTFVEQKIKEFAEQQGYPLDHSYIEAYAGAGNVVQKLTAAVQAGDAPDLITHTLQASELKFLDIIEDVDDLQKDIIKEYGKTVPGLEKRDLIDGKYWAIGHFLRSGSYWAVEKYFKDVGVDIRKDLGDYDAVREACLKVANPEKEIYGYGITANRSGDGETAVRDAVIMFGGQLVDESGQIVVLNKDPYRQYGINGLTWLKDTYTDPKWARAIPPGVQAWTDPSNNEAYLAGKIAFTGNAGTMFAKAVFDKNPIADETWLIPRPKGNGPGGRTLEGPDGMRWFVMKGAKNREAAEQLIKYLLSRDVQQQIFKTSTGYAYPAYEWGWEEKFMTEDKYAQHVTPAFKQAAWDPAGYIGGAWPGPPTSQVASLESSNFWTDMFGEVLGGKSPEDALKSAHDRAVRVFKEFGAKGE